MKKLGAVLFSLVAICIVLQFVILFRNPDIFLLLAVLADIIALNGVFLYAVNDFKKGAANQYRTFMILHLIAEVFAGVNVAFGDMVPAELRPGVLIVCGFCALLLAVLAFAKDLGRQKSMTFAVIVAVLGGLLPLILLVLSVVKTGWSYLTACRIFSKALLAAITLLAVVFKYEDKKTRNTK